jgi:hypothetical protein
MKREMPLATRRKSGYQNKRNQNRGITVKKEKIDRGNPATKINKKGKSRKSR